MAGRYKQFQGSWANKEAKRKKSKSQNKKLETESPSKTHAGAFCSFTPKRMKQDILYQHTVFLPSVLCPCIWSIFAATVVKAYSNCDNASACILLVMVKFYNEHTLQMGICMLANCWIYHGSHVYQSILVFTYWTT